MQPTGPLVFNALTLISILMIVSIIFGLMSIINLGHSEYTIGGLSASQFKLLVEVSG